MIIVKGVPQKINNLRSVNKKNLFIMLFWKKQRGTLNSCSVLLQNAVTLIF